MDYTLQLMNELFRLSRDNELPLEITEKHIKLGEAVWIHHCVRFDEALLPAINSFCASYRHRIYQGYIFLEKEDKK